MERATAARVRAETVMIAHRVARVTSRIVPAGTAMAEHVRRVAMAVRIVTGRGARRTPAVLTDRVATAIPAPTVGRAAKLIGRVAMATPVRIVRVRKVGILVRIVRVRKVGILVLTARAGRREIVGRLVTVGLVPERRAVSTARKAAPHVRRRISGSVGRRSPRTLRPVTCPARRATSSRH
ncbi:hypothetical protein CSIV_17770 [Microbacterium sp. CSI-V]|nr:hypothetical protein CSIV_17770 [Microbacterium sp. CSI-V]